MSEEPRIAGGPGMPVKLIEPPPKAKNAADNRLDAIASGSDRLPHSYAAMAGSFQRYGQRHGLRGSALRASA
jgi:hypothetical protein